ncbi:MAG: metallophosphoesterase [Deltaproteobacteria bacterium]|nr:metallophosphoesterase [Deltaproteobacteria bacterium]
MRTAALLFATCLAACSPGTDPETAEDTGDAEDPWFTLLVIPDTQYLTLNPEYGMLETMMEWILDNHEALNIKMVLQEGDLTHNNTDAEWAEADAGFSMLDGVVPYAVCVGNHDMEGNDPSQRDTTRFNQVFGLERWRQTQTFYASASETRADDHAHVFTAGGVDWMVLSLAYDPTDQALGWAEELVGNHPEHSIIVLTHAYLAPSASVSSEGRGIRDRIVDPYPNVEFVLNGHFIGSTNADRRRERADGSEVLEVFSNYQDMLLGGFGRMRQMRIEPAAGTIDVVTCNAYSECSEDEGDTLTFADLELGSNP